jgi:DedD protein
MALFKFRKGRDEPSASVAPAQTVEAVRRRAMHRLIGAAVLVLAGVIGFPLIFDNQPRPIPVDLPIDIVDPGKAKPLVMPPAATNTAAAAAVSAPAATETEPAVAAKPADPQPKAAVAPAVAPAAPLAAAPAPAPEKPSSSAAEIAEAKALDAKKARALLEGRPVAGSKTAVAAASSSPTPATGSANTAASAKAAAASDERFVVQVGAFADAAKAREVRLKVEAAGLKTYTQVVKTSDGERTRVRVGPFTDKGEATKAADKIRKLNLSVAILTL